MPLGHTEDAPIPSIDRQHAQEAKHPEQTKEHDMGEIAVWHCMRNRPKRCCPQHRVPGDASDTWMVRLEGVIVARMRWIAD